MGNQRTMADANQNLISESIKTMTECKLMQLKCEIESRNWRVDSINSQDAYAEPGQDSRNVAGVEVVVIVEDVQDVPPIFTLAPPVTKLSPGLLPGDKVRLISAS